MEASNVTRAVDSIVGGAVGTADHAVSIGGADEHDDHALIHAAIPSRRRSASPCRSPAVARARTLARSAS